MKKLIAVILLGLLACPLSAYADRQTTIASHPTNLHWRSSFVPITFHQRTVRSGFHR